MQVISWFFFTTLIVYFGKTNIQSREKRLQCFRLARAPVGIGPSDARQAAERISVFCLTSFLYRTAFFLREEMRHHLPVDW